ncbi:MAG: hypothetical protein Q9210_007469 [Variospora velana]
MKQQLVSVQMIVEIDFSAAKSACLDSSPADTLYLLDCCYGTTAAIGEGKEFLASGAKEPRTPGSGCLSFTHALTQELEHALVSNRFVTAAQLYYLTLLQAWRGGGLEQTPVHVETQNPALMRRRTYDPDHENTMDGSRPRTSIFLAPLGTTASLGGSPSAPLLAKTSTQLGTQGTDLRVLLSVRLQDTDSHTIRQLRQWMQAQQLPLQIPDIGGISFEHAVASSSTTCVIPFVIPVPIWYCMWNHAAISFISHVHWPELPQLESTWTLV